MSEVTDRGSVAEARRSPLAWAAYAEALGLTLAVPLVGYLVRRQDPFFVHAAFPWLALVALLIGIQHGLLPALVGAGLTSAGAWAHTLGNGGSLAGLRTWSVGCILVALIAGWFRDQAEAQRRQLGARAANAEAFLQRVSRLQRVLRLSHARLEERLVAEGWSLENVVRQASRELGRAATRAGVYGVVLDVLASEGQIHAASFLARAADGAARWRLESLPAAHLGRVREQAAQHPVVQRVLATGQVALLTPERLAAAHGDAVLAAVPLVTSAGHLLGVMAVHEMPFIAFSPAAFHELSVIAERLADLVAARLVVLEARLSSWQPDADAVPPFERAARAPEPELAAGSREPEGRARRSGSGVRPKLEEPNPGGTATSASTARRREEHS